MEAVSTATRCLVRPIGDLAGNIPSTSSASPATACPRLSLSQASARVCAVRRENQTISLGHSSFAFSHSKRSRFCRPAAAAAVEDAGPEVAEEEAVAEEELEYVGDDNLVIYFKAEGFVTDLAAPKVVEALEGLEGVTNVKIKAGEGGATVECMQATTVQATGVASSLVEVIQKAGFQMQTLSLGFDDDADPDTSFFNFDNTKFADDAGAQPAM